MHANVHFCTYPRVSLDREDDTEAASMFGLMAPMRGRCSSLPIKRQLHWTALIIKGLPLVSLVSVPGAEVLLEPLEGSWPPL